MPYDKQTQREIKASGGGSKIKLGSAGAARGRKQNSWVLSTAICGACAHWPTFAEIHSRRVSHPRLARRSTRERRLIKHGGAAAVRMRPLLLLLWPLLVAAAAAAEATVGQIPSPQTWVSIHPERSEFSKRNFFDMIAASPNGTSCSRANSASWQNNSPTSSSPKRLTFNSFESSLINFHFFLTKFVNFCLICFIIFFMHWLKINF